MDDFAIENTARTATARGTLTSTPSTGKKCSKNVTPIYYSNVIPNSNYSNGDSEIRLLCDRRCFILYLATLVSTSTY